MGLTNNIKKYNIFIGLLLFCILQVKASFDDLDLSRILYQDDNIVVVKEGVFSKRTGKRVQFREASNWEEEDFFTQQEKYCEKESK